jgi:hypothetical protein
MRLKIDRASLTLFAPCGEDGSTHPGDIRGTCSAQEPYRAVLICPRGLDLTDLIGAVVDASVNEVLGEAAWARPANVGQWHTQVLVHEVLPGAAPEKLLAQVLVDGQRDHERRAARPDRRA